MSDGQEVGRKRGAMTVLALVVGILFGGAPAAQALDSRAQLGAPELVKRGAPLRTSIRAQSDDADQDAMLAPPAPIVVSRVTALRPVGQTSAAAAWSAPRPALTAYRARAPPAA